MTDSVLQYCDLIQNEKILVGKKIKQAVQRELRDRERSKSDDFAYYFDVEQAEKAIKFCELIPDPNGSNIHLASFQKFIVGSLYGWRTKENDSRRFSTAFISMARKNGKSFLASCIGILSLLVENKPARGRQVLYTANTLDQAMLSFNMTRTGMLRVSAASPAIRNRLQINRREIFDKSTDSFAKALPNDSDHLDGYNATTSIIDEYHIQKNHDVINVIKSGMQQQENGLLCIISTSGFNVNGAMYEDEQLYKKVLNQDIQMDDTFIAIWELDNDSEVENTDNWIKANPLFEISKVAENMKAKLKNDYNSALLQDELKNFLVKNMNLWYRDGKSGYIPEKVWNRAVIEQPDIQGRDVVIGLDLSQKRDLTSVSWAVLMDNNELYCDSYSFVGNAEGIIEKMKRDNINYEALERAGECSISTLSTGSIDYNEVLEFIQKLVKDNQFNVLAICYDVYNSDFLTPKLELIAPIVQIKQRNLEMSEGIKTFKEEVRNGKIKLSNKNLLKIANHNLVITENDSGLVYMKKNRYGNKIDPMFATIDAFIFVNNERLLDPDRVIYDDDYYSNYDF